MIGKAEVSSQEANARFVVTSLPAHGFKGERDRQRFQPDRLYEELYCARGESAAAYGAGARFVRRR